MTRTWRSQIADEVRATSMMKPKGMSEQEARAAIRRHFSDFIWETDPYPGATPEVANIWADEVRKIAAGILSNQAGDDMSHMKSTGCIYVDMAINEIDAAIFSGDSLDDINAALAFQKYLHRWERGLLKKFCPSGQSADFDPTTS